MPKEVFDYYLWLRGQFAVALNAEMAEIMAIKAYEIFTGKKEI